ncbi:GAF domain-containing protein [Candidatus Fermentibacteria bacterium]|nr:GAF domain-containing protein [Candidatus Fermentibacteria bacterium]
MSPDRPDSPSVAFDMEAFLSSLEVSSRVRDFSSLSSILLQALGEVMPVDNLVLFVRSERSVDLSPYGESDHVHQLSLAASEAMSDRLLVESDLEGSTVVSVPVSLASEQPIGVLTVVLEPGSSVSEENRTLLLRVSRRLAPLLGQIGYLRKREGEYRKLSAILRILRASEAARDLHTLVSLLASETTEVLDAERSTLFLYDPRTDELWSFLAEGESREIRFDADLGIAGHVFQTGVPITSNDARCDQRFNREIDEKTGFTTRSLLTVPVRNAEGKVLGVFQVVNKESGDFNEGDREFMEGMAAEASVTIENFQLFEARKRMFDSLINALAESIESRDPLTAGHSYEVMRYSVAIAREMGLDRDTVEAIRYSALLHDYGKIGVPDSILKKNGPLTGEERKIIKTHVEHTRKILSNIDFEDRLRVVPEYAVQHHERLDGSGYPDGLTGEDISIGGLIIAVADVYESLTSQRHYRDPMSRSEALEVIREGCRTLFSEEVIDSMVKVLAQESGSSRDLFGEEG